MFDSYLKPTAAFFSILLFGCAMAPVSSAVVVPKTYQFSNPAQRLAIEFDSNEARLQHPQGSVAFRLTGYGYGVRLKSPAPAQPVRNGELIEYRRGELTEWYKNDARGIEQGFTLARRPGQARADEPLIIALSVEGELRPLPEPDNDGALLGSILRYGGLRSWDARGQTIATRMEVRERGIRLLVEDQAAQYPLVVDPYWTQQQILTPPGAASYFGNAVAISGTTAVVGAPALRSSLPGEAYVYVSNGTTWSLQQQLIPPDGQNGDGFGTDVAVSGDTVIIVAAGKAYIYVRNGTTWTLQTELTGDFDAHSDLVSISGETALIGGSDTIHVYVRTGTTWTQQQQLPWGNSLGLDGDTAVIGCVCDNLAKGYADVFVRTGTTWTLQQHLVAPMPGQDAAFGSSVAISGNTIVVGESGNGGYKGAAYVFVRSGGTWTEQQMLTGSDGYVYDSFGSSVSIDGDTILVGSPYKGAGGAYAFTRSGGVWTQQQTLEASDGAKFDEFGTSVAVSNNVMMVGAILRNDCPSCPQEHAGAVYVFVPNTNITLNPISVAPTGGSGAGPLIFTTLFTDPSGASDIKVVYLDIGSSIFAPNSCIMAYFPSNNGLYLYNDSSNGTAGPIHGSASNSQCTLSDGGARGLVGAGGTNLNVPFNLTFKSSFTGTKTIWGLVVSNSGAFSQWVAIGSWTPFGPPPPPPLAAVSVSPINGGGTGPQTFNALYSDPMGASDLQVVYFDFGQSIFAAHSCIVAYVQASNQLILYNDLTNGHVGSITEGSSGTLSNSQCTISGSGGTTTPSGTNLTVPFKVTFLPGFHGTQNVWGLAQSYSGTQSAWKLFGTWTTGIAAVSVSPNSGGGVGPQTFKFVSIDPQGGSDIQVVYLDFGNSIFAPGSCIVAYVPYGNALYLYNDASSGVVAGSPIMEGSSGTLSNSQCTLSGSGNSAIIGGLNLTVPLGLTFSNTFTGAKTIWGLAQSYSGAQSGWQMLGSWTP